MEQVKGGDLFEFLASMEVEQVSEDQVQFKFTKIHKIHTLQIHIIHRIRKRGPTLLLVEQVSEDKEQNSQKFIKKITKVLCLP